MKHLWAFMAVTLPLVIAPGASTAVVLRNSIAGGVRAGVLTAIGVNAGSVCYGFLSAFGVALALQQWPGAWTVLRGAGVVYLTWLGVQSLVRATTGADAPCSPSVRPGRATAPAAGAPARAALRNPGAHIREGFMTNALNPAIASFYFAVVPQFVPRGAPVVRGVLLLTAVHVTLAATWHVVWASAGGTLAETLGASRPRRILECITGLALLALAVAMVS